MSKAKDNWRVTREGIVLPIIPPKEPTVPYPEPIKTSDPPDLRKTRIKALFQVLLKETELARTMLTTLDRVNQPQLKEVLEANFFTKLKHMDEALRSIITEATALTLTKKGGVYVVGKRGLYRL